MLAQCRNTAAKFAKLAIYVYKCVSILYIVMHFHSKDMLSLSITSSKRSFRRLQTLVDYCHTQLWVIKLMSPFPTAWKMAADTICLVFRWAIIRACFGKITSVCVDDDFRGWLLRGVAPYRKGLMFWNLVLSQLKGVRWLSNKANIPAHLLWDWWRFLGSFSNNKGNQP